MREERGRRRRKKPAMFVLLRDADSPRLESSSLRSISFSLSPSFFLRSYKANTPVGFMYVKKKNFRHFDRGGKTKLGPMSFLCQGYIFIEGWMKKRFRESLLEFIFFFAVPRRRKKSGRREEGRVGGSRRCGGGGEGESQ